MTKKYGATIAVLTVPSEFAQESADRVVKAGIKAIWNFTNIKLKLPEDVVYTSDAADVFVRSGWASNENGSDIINLNRTDDSTVQVNLDSITGWYNEED